MLETIQAKIFSSLEETSFREMLARWKNENQTIVFTNGCFDLLHFGHLAYLAEAQQKGDKLLIGLNSQASVQRLKGKDRPIKDEKTRAFLLASLSMVDLVVLFDTDTPLELIKAVQPDWLVKGGDYQINEIVGADYVQSYGGQVGTITFLEGFSSTNYINKIRGNYS
ncbi:MAG: D-glycero-beta-D-manno-heptose 1-phosphate adenylyltransferase [Bacteroidota bacterium]